MAQPIITGYPLSLAQSDDCMQKTDKSVLQRKLELYQSGINISQLPPFVATIIDGGLLFRTLILKASKFATFADLARILLFLFCVVKNTREAIHALIDTYKEGCIKGAERDRRQEENRDYSITGPDQSPKIKPPSANC